MTGTLGFLRGAATVSPVLTGAEAGVEAGLTAGATGCSSVAEDDALSCDHALRLAAAVTCSRTNKKNGARIFLDNCMMTSDPVALLLATLTARIAYANNWDVFPACAVGGTA
jgi:hypothetical protein